MLNLILFPFRLVWSAIGLLLGLLGTLVAIIFAVALMAAGLLLAITFVLSFVGIPLFILGLLLLFRAIF